MVSSEGKWFIGTLTCMAFFASVGYYGHSKKKEGLALFGGAMAMTPPALVAVYLCGVAMSTPGANFDFNF